eukprot:3407714-Rhodomonas_salina.1
MHLGAFHWHGNNVDSQTSMRGPMSAMYTSRCTFPRELAPTVGPTVRGGGHEIEGAIFWPVCIIIPGKPELGESAEVYAVPVAVLQVLAPLCIEAHDIGEDGRPARPGIIGDIQRMDINEAVGHRPVQSN